MVLENQKFAKCWLSSIKKKLSNLFNENVLEHSGMHWSIKGAEQHENKGASTYN